MNHQNHWLISNWYPSLLLIIIIINIPIIGVQMTPEMTSHKLPSNNVFRYEKFNVITRFGLFFPFYTLFNLKVFNVLF